MATVRLDQKARALVRAVPDSYTDALASYFGSGPTDLNTARKQHQRYCSVLEENGIHVTVLDTDHNHPDCMFVEDQAVVVGRECNKHAARHDEGDGGGAATRRRVTNVPA